MRTPRAPFAAHANLCTLRSVYRASLQIGHINCALQCRVQPYDQVDSCFLRSSLHAEIHSPARTVSGEEDDDEEEEEGEKHRRQVELFGAVPDSLQLLRCYDAAPDSPWLLLWLTDYRALHRVGVSRVVSWSSRSSGLRVKSELFVGVFYIVTQHEFGKN